jgi:oligopeptide transport system substrate-binding protein
LVPLALVGQTAHADRTFNFRITGEPETLDWNRAHTTIETFVLMNLMEGLLTFDSSLNVAPSLAESWKVSADGKTYTFKIRPGVKWSDGVPLKAKDFAYSWKRLLSASTGAAYAYFLFDIENAEAFSKGKLKSFAEVGIKAPDDGTLVVKLARPVAHWIYIPTFWVTFPMREDLVEKKGSAWEAPGKMVTLGPFLLAEHDHDSRIVLKANPNYWGKRGNVDTAIAQIIKDDSTALSLYESGKLDFLTDIAALDLKRLAGRPDLKTFPYLRTGYIGFVVGKYPLSNVHVRRAIAMAIDKSKLGQIMHGGQEAASSWVPPRLMGHSNRIGLPFDPKRAKTELAASGIDQGRPLTLEMILPNWDKNLILAQYVQNELQKNLGVNIVLQPFDNKTFRAQADLKAYPMFVANWTGDYPDPDNFLSVYLGSSGNNRTGWENGKFDELVLAARNTHDPKKREKLYVQAQKIFLEDDAVIVPLYYEPNMALVRGRVRGLELNEVNDLLLRKVSLAE